MSAFWLSFYSVFDAPYVWRCSSTPSSSLLWPVLIDHDPLQVKWHALLIVSLEQFGASGSGPVLLNLWWVSELLWKWHSWDLCCKLCAARVSHGDHNCLRKSGYWFWKRSPFLRQPCRSPHAFLCASIPQEWALRHMQIVPSAPVKSKSSAAPS